MKKNKKCMIASLLHFIIIFTISLSNQKHYNLAGNLIGKKSNTCPNFFHFYFLGNGSKIYNSFTITQKETLYSLSNSKYFYFITTSKSGIISLIHTNSFSSKLIWSLNLSEKNYESNIINTNIFKEEKAVISLNDKLYIISNNTKNIEEFMIPLPEVINMTPFDLDFMPNYYFKSDKKYILIEIKEKCEINLKYILLENCCLNCLKEKELIWNTTLNNIYLIGKEHNFHFNQKIKENILLYEKSSVMEKFIRDILVKVEEGSQDYDIFMIHAYDEKSKQFIKIYNSFDINNYIINNTFVSNNNNYTNGIIYKNTNVNDYKNYSISKNEIINLNQSEIEGELNKFYNYWSGNENKFYINDNINQNHQNYTYILKNIIVFILLLLSLFFFIILFLFYHKNKYKNSNNTNVIENLDTINPLNQQIKFQNIKKNFSEDLPGIENEITKSNIVCNLSMATPVNKNHLHNKNFIQLIYKDLDHNNVFSQTPTSSKNITNLFDFSQKLGLPNPLNPIISNEECKIDFTSYIYKNNNNNRLTRLEKDFKEFEIIKKTNFGCVLKAKHKIDEEPYAIKIIKLCDPIKEKSVIMEAKTMTKIHSKHIVEYKTCWIDRSLGRLETVINFNDDYFNTKNYSIKSLSDNEIKNQKNNLKQHSQELNESSNKKRSKTENLNLMNNIYFFIQMEFCEGMTLSQYIKNHNNVGISNKTMFIFTYQILKSLRKIHIKNIIHRDINPDNIYIVSETSIKIGDFGSAKEIKLPKIESNFYKNFIQSQSSTNVNKLINSYDEDEIENQGPSLYLSPEQIMKKKVNLKVDIYATGIVLYEMMCNFENDEIKLKKILELKDNQIIMREVIEKFPLQTKLVMRMTAKEPQNRPDCNEILNSEEFLKWRELVEY